MTFLCDTNIISEIMKPKPCLSVQLWFAEQDSLCLSVISLEEIIFGLVAKQAAKKLAWFKKLLMYAGISQFERKRKQAFPAKRHGLPEMPPRATLGWSYSGLRTNQLMLVTHNTKEFSRISKLQVVDWY